MLEGLAAAKEGCRGLGGCADGFAADDCRCLVRVLARADGTCVAGSLSLGSMLRCLGTLLGESRAALTFSLDSCCLDSYLPISLFVSRRLRGDEHDSF